MIKKLLPCLLLFTMAVSSCGDREKYISEDLYITVFTELVILNQINDEIADTEKDEIREEVFTHYNISEEEFRIAHEFYERQNEKQVARMDSISKNLRDVRDEISQAERDQRAVIDSLRKAEDNQADEDNR
ncbi:MAG: hypothetical protein WEA56_11340 [Balneolaceae bacterium]